MYGIISPVTLNTLAVPLVCVKFEALSKSLNQPFEYQSSNVSPTQSFSINFDNVWSHSSGSAQHVANPTIVAAPSTSCSPKEPKPSNIFVTAILIDDQAFSHPFEPL